jgi:hypothetical protein
VWKELAQEFPRVFNQCVEQTLWNGARDTELRRPLNQVEEIRRKSGISHEQIAHDRIWNKRPDGITFKIPTKIRAGVICLLEFKSMSDVTSRYIVRAKRVAETQYASLKSALVITMQRQGWKAEQVSFIAGARSLNAEELKKNLAYFEVPSTSVEPIRAKLVMTIFDEYANILKGMYSIRFNGRPDHGGTSARPANGSSDHGDTPACPAGWSSPPLINSLTAWQPIKVRKRKEREKKGEE